jgi:hypothetical protein
MDNMGIPTVKDRSAFFSDPGNHKILTEAVDKLKSANEEPPAQMGNVITQTLLLLNLFISNANHADKYCEISIEEYGPQLMSEARKLAKDSPMQSSAIQLLFSALYAFACEWDFSRAEGFAGFEPIRQWALANQSLFNERRLSIAYSTYHTPVALLKIRKNRQNIDSYLRYPDHIEEIRKQTVALNSALEQREKKANDLKQFLDEVSTGLGVVALGNGFNDMLKEKNLEKWLGFALLAMLGVGLLAPLWWEIT